MSKIVLPGVTDEVKVPAFANMIDSVQEFTAVFKRPKTKKESREIGLFFKELGDKVMQAHEEHEQAITALKNPPKEKLKAMNDAFDKQVQALNDEGNSFTKDYFTGFEDLKDADGKKIKSTADYVEAILQTPGYDMAIARALNYLWTGNKAADYEQGN